MGQIFPTLIIYEGSARQFASHLLIETLNYGTLEGEGDTHAIIRLLQEVQRIVGQDKQRDISDLIQKLNLQSADDENAIDTDNNRVFISYRRNVSALLGQLVFSDLRAAGYDVFMDIHSQDSGRLEDVIFRQIAARQHFIILLAPETLERCVDPNDLLRREIEYAIKTNRNIIPVIYGDFNFNDVFDPSGIANTLRQYRGQVIPEQSEFLSEALRQLRAFLSQGHQFPVQEAPSADSVVVRQQLASVRAQAEPSPQELDHERQFGTQPIEAVSYKYYSTDDLMRLARSKSLSREEIKEITDELMRRGESAPPPSPTTEPSLAAAARDFEAAINEDFRLPDFNSAPAAAGSQSGGGNAFFGNQTQPSQAHPAYQQQRAPEQAPAPQYNTSYERKPEKQKEAKGWEGSTFMALMAATIFIPLLGVLVGGYLGYNALGNPARRSQAIALLVTAGIMAVIWFGCLENMGSLYSTPGTCVDAWGNLFFC